MLKRRIQPINLTDERFALFFIMLFAFLLRLAVCFNTAVVNNDGAYYINQARWVYGGLWQDWAAHGAGLLTLYTVIIAGLYPVFGDWMIAAHAVNLFFGTVLLIPIFHLVKRFCTVEASLLAALVFAVLPTVVFNSVDFVRDPLAWFLIACALWALPPPGDSRERRWLLASLLFLLAAATRLETIVMPAIVVIFILFNSRKNKVLPLAYFIFPWLLLAAGTLTYLLLAGTQPFHEYVTWLSNGFRSTLTQYGAVRQALKTLIPHPPAGIPATYFDNIAEITWLIPAALLLQNALGATHYLFFFIFLIGIAPAWRKHRHRRDFVCLLVLAGGTTIMLYLSIFSHWLMEHRWVVPVFLILSPLLGTGFDVIAGKLREKTNIKPPIIWFLLAAVVLMATLPKDLKPREQDKVIFREIGETITHREQGKDLIEVLTLSDYARWISLYANLPSAGVFSPDKYRDYAAHIPASYEDFPEMLRSRKIRYFVWEERHWPAGRFDLEREARPEDLLFLGEWRHRDTGRIRLYRVLPPGKRAHE